MSSAADNAQWTLSALWTIDRESAPTQSQPGATLPDGKRRSIAGQISEHLNERVRRRTFARASLPETWKRAVNQELSPHALSDAPAEDTPPPFPAQATSPAVSLTGLSENEQQALDALRGQELVPQPRGTPYLTFILGNLRWGIPLLHLREALPSTPIITPLPFSPLWLHGLINLRGEALGLVNLSDLLLDPVIASNLLYRVSASAPLVVAEHEGTPLGLQVQELGEVVYLEENELRQLPGSKTRSLPAFAVTYLQAAWFPADDEPPVLILDLPRLVATLLEQMTAKEALGDR